MNGPALLDRLREAGVRLVRTDAGLAADVMPGADLDAHREVIAAHTTTLLDVLALQDEIVRTASAARDGFDRQHYDQLWERWHALQDKEAT